MKPLALNRACLVDYHKNQFFEQKKKQCHTQVNEKSGNVTLLGCYFDVYPQNVKKTKDNLLQNLSKTW